MGGACETYFPIQDAPSLNLHSNIMCLGLIPDCFLHVLLKEVCPLTPTCGSGVITRLVRRRNGSLLLWIDKPPSKTSCLKEAKPPKKPTNEL